MALVANPGGYRGSRDGYFCVRWCLGVVKNGDDRLCSWLGSNDSMDLAMLIASSGENSFCSDDAVVELMQIMSGRVKRKVDKEMREKG